MYYDIEPRSSEKGYGRFAVLHDTVGDGCAPVGPLYGQRGRRGQSRRRPWRGGMPFLPAQRAQQEVAHGLGQSGRPLHVAAVRVVACEQWDEDSARKYCQRCGHTRQVSAL